MSYEQVYDERWRLIYFAGAWNCRKEYVTKSRAFNGSNARYFGFRSFP